jgi:UDPglucose--hexose-1-phosphate uridylyltransferase
MDFIKVVKTSRFLDPMNGFQAIERFSEVRYDPLTKHTTRILDFPVKEMERVDLTPLIEKSKAICPFCPELVELVTPKFPTGRLNKERYAVGESLCFPNAFPYDENGAVTVMSRNHYLALKDFDASVIGNAIGCCLEYLSDLVENQPEAVYQSINWNYMPLAGGSIVHPHLQVTASTTPTNYYTSMLSMLDLYRQKRHTDFWHELVRQEEHLGERFVARMGRMAWLVAFAPLGVFDIIGVMDRAYRPSEMTDGIMHDLVSGVLKVLGYIDSLNMYSLNMSLYFLLDDAQFTPHVRICPRVSIPPFGTSQINYMRMLHNEPMTTIKPEDVCLGMKTLW